MFTAPRAISRQVPRTVPRSAATPIRVHDDFLPDERRAELDRFVRGGSWAWGWKSNTTSDNLRFWHKHYAGSKEADHRDVKTGEVLHAGYDCAEELCKAAPIVWSLWEDLRDCWLYGHTLVRCYANALQYGSDGTLHTDSVEENSFTTIFYPHEKWYPNWAGETVFFNREKTDIVACCYPKPGRLCTFPGTLPHIARGVSRSCPVLRVTLMFKTQVLP